MPVSPGIWSVDRVLPWGTWVGGGGVRSAVATPALYAYDNDNVAGVQFYIGGTAISGVYGGGPGTGTYYAMNYDTRDGRWPNGAYTQQAVIQDRIGNVTVIQQAVTHNNAPVFTNFFPGNGAGVTGVISFGATVQHYSAWASIQLYIDFAPWNPAFYNSGSYGLDTHYLGYGWHTFTAIATDAQGNQARLDYGIFVANTPPPAGYVFWGDYESWFPGDGETHDGYYTMRMPSPSYEERYSAGVDNAAHLGIYRGYWAAIGPAGDAAHDGAGQYPWLGTPGNPNPTYYQMRARMYGGPVEGGTDHNHVRIWWLMNTNGVEYEMFVDSFPDGSSTGYSGPILNINGGEAFILVRWANDGGWNYSQLRDVRIYYDFVVKAPFSS